MSGSPLYINGRVIGAAAYGLTSFPKEPIAGVTPIEDIIQTSEYDNIKVNIDISELKFSFDQKNAQMISHLIQKELLKRMGRSLNQKGLFPIKLFSTSRGIHSGSLFLLNPLFTPLQNLKISKNSKDMQKPTDIFKLLPADAVSIPLIRGDFEYSASGTVTHIEGDKVYMFGHPFFNLGTIELPLHKAEVITVLHSFNQSSKLMETKHAIGTVLQDRRAAVYGKLGREPTMIPVKIYVKGQKKSVSVQICHHPLLTPSLSGITLSSVFSSLFKEVGFQSIKVNGRIYLKDEKDVILDDFYSGLDSITEFSSMIMVINFFLMNNQDKYVNIQKMDFEVETSEIMKTAEIKKVLINKNHFFEGEPVNLKIFYKKTNGAQIKEEISIRTPNIGAGKVFYILIGGKGAISQFDSKNIKASYFPSKLKYLIRAINNLRKNNRIYFKVFIPKRGIYIDGHEYSGIPDTEQNLFKSNNVEFNKNIVRYSTITEYQLPVSYVIKGQKILMIKTKEQ